jgi:hypothetical protein
MGLSIFIFLAAVVVVGIPLLTVVHELGHALTAAAVVGGRPVVLQGPEPRRFELSLWRVDLRLHGLVLPHRAWIGWAMWQPQASRRRHAVALAGGPAASALAAGICLYAAAAARGYVAAAFTILAVDATGQFLSSAVPVRYPSFAGAYANFGSDGWKIWNLVRGRDPWPRRVTPAVAAPADRALPAPTAPDHAAAASPAAAAPAPGPAAARS